jgi:large subunit ribosomal protein L28
LPKKCVICGKSVRSGFNVSHSHHKTKRKFRPNLQKVNIILNGRKKKAYVCTQCLTAGKVLKPFKHPTT